MVKANIDERVDTEIANKIMRALDIRNKAEDTRVETELINGTATRRMHATVSKKSAEQIAGMTFTAHDEGLITPVKIIFGGTSGAEPIEVDGSGEDKAENDVDLEDAEISQTPQKIATPKSKKKKKKKMQSDERPDRPKSGRSTQRKGPTTRSRRRSLGTHLRSRRHHSRANAQRT